MECPYIKVFLMAAFFHLNHRNSIFLETFLESTVFWESFW